MALFHIQLNDEDYYVEAGSMFAALVAWGKQMTAALPAWELEDPELCALVYDGPVLREPAAAGSELLCEDCAKVFCPHGEPGHFFHDGCPSCDAPSGGRQVSCHCPALPGEDCPLTALECQARGEAANPDERASVARSFVVTDAWLRAHTSSGKSAGWTAAQLKVLGIEWPPRAGWVQRVEGTTLTADEVRLFERLAAEARPHGRIRHT